MHVNQCDCVAAFQAGAEYVDAGDEISPCHAEEW